MHYNNHFTVHSSQHRRNLLECYCCGGRNYSNRRRNRNSHRGDYYSSRRGNYGSRRRNHYGSFGGNDTRAYADDGAGGCYDYNDCMSDISSINGFDYSSCGTGYSCSGNYSVAINNSHNYLSVILSYNGSCIGIHTCSRR